MNPPHRVLVPHFLDEGVTLGEDPGGYRFGRSRVVRGSSSGKPYLLRRGLLNGVGERIYYQFAVARDIAVRPVQFLRNRRGVGSAAVWWANGGVEAETIRPIEPNECVVEPEEDTSNPLDIPRSMALDLFLDNFNPFSGWMFEGGRVYRLFNHQTLGMGSGPVALLTRYRLLMGSGILPMVDLEIPFEALKEGEKQAFLDEAAILSELPEEAIHELTRIPRDIGVEAFRLCTREFGDGPGSHEAKKLLFRRGEAFLHEYSHLYCLARQRELRLQLRLNRRA